MMWGVALLFFCCVQGRVLSTEIDVKCREFYDFPSNRKYSPSFLADLKAELVTLETGQKLNISWAVSIDASTEYLKGTLIKISGEPSLLCEYNPRLAEADVTGSTEKWFHYLVEASYGMVMIQAANLPLPPLGSGTSYRAVSVKVPYQQSPETVTSRPTEVSRDSIDFSDVKNTTSSLTMEYIMVIIFGGLTCLMILISCYIIYRSYGAKIVPSIGFKKIPQSSMVPVRVLVVYPAENSAFQQAIVALAEFLQWHGGCNVAIDMWQQGKIAKLGPMRWLAEQAKAADKVLIVCPQPTAQPSHSPPSSSFQEPSIPAAAHDLYPLILNMVASHAKSARDLAKFWVVHLCEQHDKRPDNLALELRTCKTFCLMKDLNKLCRSLHTHWQDNKKTSDLIYRPGISYSEKNTVKLREAVEKHSREVEPLGTVITTV